MTYLFVARDPNGAERVWGKGPTPDIAKTRCRDEMLSYLRERPDLGPLSRWTISERPDTQ